MNYLTKLLKIFLSGIFLLTYPFSYAASAEDVPLLVWANEAIIASYTFSAANYQQDQKKIAQYFTSAGWIAFNKALNASKLPEVIKKNAYEVTAVATAPPELVTLDPTHWTVVMPILVQYKNPQYQQQQQLKVTLGFTTATVGQGIRGYAITSLQSVVTQPPCECATPATPPAKE